MTVRVVGVVLVHNEDVYVERVVRNVASLCDRIHAFDHVSTDRTGDVLSDLARELDHLTVRRTSDARESHRVLEPLAGTATWVLGVDGDELYDPGALARLRPQLEAGAYADAFHVKAHVLNCTALDEEQGAATGYMSPPSRPVTKFFNMAAVDSWTGCLERLHGGAPQFRPGYDWSSLRYVSDETSWADDPLRMLHLCFLRRSSADSERPRPSDWACPRPARSGAGREDRSHRLRYRRHIDPRMKAYRAQGSTLEGGVVCARPGGVRRRASVSRRRRELTPGPRTEDAASIDRVSQGPSTLEERASTSTIVEEAPPTGSNGTSRVTVIDRLRAGRTSTSPSSGTSASCSARSSGATSSCATSRRSSGSPGRSSCPPSRPPSTSSCSADSRTSRPGA